MPLGERGSWRSPTLMLCFVWLVATLVVILVSGLANAVLQTPIKGGFVAKMGPFIVAGYVTGRLQVLGGARRVLAAGVLALTSAAAWTLFAFATTPTAVPADRALGLFVSSLPAMLVGGAWAVLGLFLGGRRPQQTPTGPPGGGEADGAREPDAAATDS